MLIRVLAPLALIALLTAACSGSSPTAVSPSSTGGALAVTSGQLSGTWSLRSIQPTGQSEQATPGGATYTVTFADGRLSTRADCNTCGGSFTLAGQSLTAGPALACTRAACATMAFENVYTTMLAGESAVAVTGDTLTLSSPRGVLRFTR